MKYLLDTNICIYLINQKPLVVRERFEQQRVGDIGISSITLAELAYGVAKSQYVDRNQRALEQFLLPLMIAPFDQQAALAYGSVRADLERRGLPIGPLDLQIAAHALSLDIILVTNNTEEFACVSGLQLENWAVG